MKKIEKKNIWRSHFFLTRLSLAIKMNNDTVADTNMGEWTTVQSQRGGNGIPSNQSQDRGYHARAVQGGPRAVQGGGARAVQGGARAVQGGGARAVHGGPRAVQGGARAVQGGARGGARARQDAKKLICNKWIASNWNISGCHCTKGKKCGFGHGRKDQVETPDTKYINDKIRAGLNGDNAAFANFTLCGDSKWTEKNRDLLELRSYLCKRYLACHKKHHDGSLNLSDICCGGINCVGGICYDSPDFDQDKTFLLDRGDWIDGVSSGDGGIKLTEFGLIPLKIQERMEKERLEDEIKLKIAQDLMSGPSLSKQTHAAQASHTWAKRDWAKVSEEADDRKLLDQKSHVGLPPPPYSMEVSVSVGDYDEVWGEDDMSSVQLSSKEEEEEEEEWDRNVDEWCDEDWD